MATWGIKQMEISYDEQEDILFISFNNEQIIKDVSYNWNVNIGLTAQGIGQITILDAKAANLLPLNIKTPRLISQEKSYA